MDGFIAVVAATLIGTIATISLSQTVIPVLIAVLSSGFVFGLFKIMPERRSILVQASENAVKVVNDAISTLQKELTQARLEIVRLEAELNSSQASAKEQRDRDELRLQTLQTQVVRLQAQLDLYREIRGG